METISLPFCMEYVKISLEMTRELLGKESWGQEIPSCGQIPSELHKYQTAASYMFLVVQDSS